MYKRIMTALLALMCLVPALAEGAVLAGDGYTIAYPEDLQLVPAEMVAAYFDDALADVQGVVDTDEALAIDPDLILMASSADGTRSVNVTYQAADGVTALEAAQTAVDELVDAVDGLSAEGPVEETFGEHTFAAISYTLYGVRVRQCLTVAGERLYYITCTDLTDAEIETMLASFTTQD